MQLLNFSLFTKNLVSTCMILYYIRISLGYGYVKVGTILISFIAKLFMTIFHFNYIYSHLYSNNAVHIISFQVSFVTF